MPATLAELKSRIRSIGSIGKITKAMKMVAASKLRTAQEQLECARKFQGGVTDAWKEPELAPKDNSNTLFVVLTSDRGLCGGVNTQVLRKVRPRMRAVGDKAGNAVTVMTIGDKGRSSLEREFGDNFVETVAEVGRVKRLTFKQVSMVADILNKTPFDQAEYAYNAFVSSQSSLPTIVPLYPAEAMVANTDIALKYENEGGDETYTNFWEFRNAARLFHFSAEAYASETAARMNAMSSSSKNAGEMLSAISIRYNRQRQAKITGELIEIISGAAAAEAQVAASD